MQETAWAVHAVGSETADALERVDNPGRFHALNRSRWIDMVRIAVWMLPVLLVTEGFAQTPYSLNVPVVAPGTITVDGLLDEPEWAAAGSLSFGPTGISGGYDNELVYNTGGNAADDDQPLQIYKFLHNGNGLVYVSMESDDESIQTDNSGVAWFNISQSDGVGFFSVFRKGGTPGNAADYITTTITFYPDAGAGTVMSATQGFYLGIPAGMVVSGTGGWDWSFQSGSNTVNDPSDTDAGYIVEFVFDITYFSYLITDTDITVGIQSTDHDGLPLGEQWPWDNSFGWVYQWSNGDYPQNYTVNHLLLESGDPCNTDFTGPSVVAAGPISATDDKTILVIFDEPVDATLAEDSLNYTLNGGSVFLSADRDDDAQNFVYLSLIPGTPLTTGVNHSVTVSNVSDLCGNPLENGTSDLFQFCTLESAVNQILNCQLPDGAVTMKHTTQDWLVGQPIWIEPYFSHYAALGLLYAYQISPDSDYLDAVRSWIEWYAGHMQADGTVTVYAGNYPNYTSTGDYDASDSYAAMYLIVVDKYLEITSDTTFLEWVYPYVQKAVDAMDLTLQPDWLTWAKPTYLVKYTMDNSETWMGYDAASKIAGLKGETFHQSTWSTTATNVKNTINTELYLGDSYGRYSVGKFSNGSLSNTWENYYPDGMAQCFAIDYDLEADDPRAALVWQNTIEKFVPGYVPQSDSISFFFTYSAMRMNAAQYTDIGYVMMMKHKSVYDYLHEAAYVLHLLDAIENSQMLVPSWQLY